MNTYIVQFRSEHGGRLFGLGEFIAQTAADAIIQAAQMLLRAEDDAVEFIATRTL